MDKVKRWRLLTSSGLVAIRAWLTPEQAALVKQWDAENRAKVEVKQDD